MLKSVTGKLKLVTFFHQIMKQNDPYEGENEVDDDGDVTPIINDEEENH